MTASSPQEYISQIKSVLQRSTLVTDWNIINELVLGSKGHFRVRLTLNNGDFVEASEFFQATSSGFEPQRYRYQWMDETKTKLRRRWDNAPHFPEIETYPNHVHIECDNNVFPSPALSIVDLIEILESSISGSESEKL